MRYFFLSLLTLSPMSLAAEDVTAALEVNLVELFPRGATLSLDIAADLEPGSHTLRSLIPADIAQGLDQWRSVGGAISALQVGATVSTDPEAFETPAQIAARDLVDAAENAVDAQVEIIRRLKAQLAALDARKALLLSATAGEELPSFTDLTDFGAALGIALTEIAEAREAPLSDLAEAQEELAKLEDDLERRMAALQALTPPNETWIEMVAEVVAEGGPFSLTTEAFDPTSGWAMAYDVSLREDSFDLSITRNVRLSNNSPLTWTDARVQLSTAEPDLRPGVTEVRRSIARIGQPRRFSSAQALEESMMEAEVVVMEAARASDAAPMLFDVDFGQAVVTYTLPQDLTIYAGRDMTLALAPLAFDVDIYLAAAPRFDDTAYLMADATNVTGEPLLPGPATLRRGDAIVARGTFPAVAAGEDMTLGFGKDSEVALEFALLDAQTGDQGFIRSSNTRQDNIRLTATNLGAEEKAIRLRYAVPTSQQEDLEIDIAMSPQPTRRDIDDMLGVHEWELTLASGSDTDIALLFDFSWPEDQSLNWRP